MIMMMAESGAQAALRGYRLQALYTLYRIFEGDDSWVFHLEGRYEDLDVYSATGELLEANQVKALGENLTISSLSPEKDEAFFRRALKRRGLYPKVQEQLVSYGPIGPQMTEGWASDGSERRTIVKSLENLGYTISEAHQIISDVQLVLVSERELQDKVFDKLRDTITGCDPEVAFNYLHGWWLAEAERKSRITRSDLIVRLTAIGRLISESAAYHQVWFSTVVPITDDILINTDDLATEFYRGVSARYSHILADVDIERPERLEEIQQAFSVSRLVILRGASGQGKSALAYRYLHDFVPPVWRFEVRSLNTQQQALTVATALLGHLKAIGGLAYIYIDVAPGTTAWVRLAAELMQFENARVLVTVREEDWRRADTEGVLLTLKEVELRFDEDEARPLFERLVQRYTPLHVLTFEDAWQRFGRAGPLLEFAYFVRENETLLERLSSQVNRLRDAVRMRQIDAAEIEMLRQVSVAAAFGARLNLVTLAETLGLPDVRRTVELLENEYLVRLSEDQRLVDGLHPIRSTILADLLTDKDFEPWATATATCLPAMVETDLEIFLLHVFSRKYDEAKVVLETLERLDPRSWTGRAGIFRSLLWLSVRDYAMANLDLIRDARERFGSGWYMVLMADVGNVNRVAPGLMRPYLEELDFVPPENRQAMTEFRERLTPSDSLFNRVGSWLQHRAFPLESPKELSDWVAYAELVFFSSHLNLGEMLWLRVSNDQIENAIETLPIDVVADLVYAISFSTDGSLQNLLSSARPKLLERFQVETQTPTVEDDGQTIRAHFLIDPAYVAGTEDFSAVNKNDSENIIHEETMRHVNLLRRIVPDREAFGCQGYGHMGGLLPLGHDDSTKTGIPGQNLPPLWATSLNSRFNNFSDYMFRPKDWGEYAQAIFQMRLQSLLALEKLISALNLHFRKKGILDLASQELLEVWDLALRSVERHPQLPRDSVDEWGFVGEGTAQTTQPLDSSGTQPRVWRSLSVAKHKPYLDGLRNYASHLGNFFRQANQALQVIPYLGRVTDPGSREKLRELLDQNNIQENVGRLPVINLADALKALPTFQREFKTRFASFFSVAEVETLERREHTLFTKAFSLWCQFVERPDRSGIQNADQDAERRFKAALNQIRTRIRKRFKSLGASGIRGEIQSEKTLWNREPALWITFDIDEPTELYQAFETVYFAVIDVLPSGIDFHLEHHAALINWPNLWIVPLVRGKTLGKIGWRFNMLTLVLDPPMTSDRWYNFAIQQIPEASWDLLGLECWDHPRLELAQRLSAATLQTGLLAGHMASLEKLVEMTSTETGQHILRNYADEQGKRISTAFQHVIDAMGEIAHYLGENVEEVSRSPRLQAVLDVLNTAGSDLIPGLDENGQILMNQADMSAWRDQIREVIPSFERLYLEWVGDILDKIAPI